MSIGGTKFRAYDVYKNIHTMYEYRGGEQPEMISRDKFIINMNHKEYTTIVGETRNGTLAVMMLAPGAKYAKRSASFKQLLRFIPKKVYDVMVVSDEPLSSHIHKVIAAHLDNVTEPMHISTHLYKQFIVEVPKHVSVPEHTIMSEEEIAVLVNEYYIRLETLPKILDTDVMAVWIGARAGDVIRIKRVSEVAGYSIAYRYCVTKLE